MVRASIVLHREIAVSYVLLVNRDDSLRGAVMPLLLGSSSLTSSTMLLLLLLFLRFTALVHIYKSNFVISQRVNIQIKKNKVCLSSTSLARQDELSSSISI